jgi:hypothetical protein
MLEMLLMLFRDNKQANLDELVDNKIIILCRMADCSPHINEGLVLPVSRIDRELGMTKFE